MKKVVSLLISVVMVLAVLPIGAYAYIGNDGSGVNYTFSDSTSPAGVAYADGNDLKAALGGGPWWSIGTFNGNPAADNYAGIVRLDSSKFGGRKALRVERTSTSNNWGDIGVKYDMPAGIAGGTGDIIVAETTVVPTWTGTSNGASVFYFEAVDSSGTMIARIFGKSGRILNYKTNTQSSDKAMHTGAFLLEDGEYTIKMSLNLSANTAEFSISAPRTSASGAAAGTGFSIAYADGVETLKTTAPVALKSSGTHADVRSIRFGYAGYTGAAYYKNLKVGKQTDIQQEKVNITEDFQNNAAYTNNMTTAALSALKPSWLFHNGTGGIKIGTALVNDSTDKYTPKSLLVGTISNSSSDNPYVEIPVSSQSGLLQVEYTMLTSGTGTPRPFFEAYSSNQKRLRLSSSWRDIIAVQNLSSDTTDGIYLWQNGADFRYKCNSSPIKFRYVIDVANNRYDLYVTNSGLDAYNANLVSPAENIGNQTVVRRNIPLFASGAGPIDRLRFGGASAGGEYTLALQDIKAETLPLTVTDVYFTNGSAPGHISEFDNATALKANVTVANNVDNGAKYATLILAIYNAENQLYSVDISAPADIPEGVSVPLSVTASANIPENGDEYTARAIVWDTVSGMTPIGFDRSLGGKDVIKKNE